jgi:hypothetical protein
MSLVFGGVRQLGYITRDLEGAVGLLVETAGIGPWFVRDRCLTGVINRGQEISINIKVALANSGALQLELIQPRVDEPSVYNEWLAKYPELLLVQHVSSWSENFDESYASALRSGYQAALQGATGSGRFAYFQHPDRPDFTFEVAELTEVRRTGMQQIADAAKNWDGRNPVRQR